jgi:aryl-alcohol dehydrogenase-like predicted oxidoreductase
MVISRQVVVALIDLACQRLGVETLDLLQFHWWDYSNSAYLDTLQSLAELQPTGKIRQLGLANFNTAHLQQVLGQGIEVVSNQVQFSLVDQRPLAMLVPFCQQQGVRILAYGSLLGGFLSEAYLGQPEPMSGVLNPSQRKYWQMIRLWGGWQRFQQLLYILQDIARKHSVRIADIGLRSILATPGVAGVILEADQMNTPDWSPAQIWSFQLDSQDWDAIADLVGGPETLLQQLGDCGDEYRYYPTEPMPH